MTESPLKNSTLIQNNVAIKSTAQDSSNNNASLINNNNNNNSNNNGSNNNGASNTNNNGTKQHHFRHHNLISHNQFIKQDVKEVSLLDSMKSSIIDDSPIRRNNYIPEKVYVRTNLCLLTGDQNEIAKEKERRKKDVMECGFSSAYKEPYKPLGTPIIDTNALIIDCLKINPSSIQKSSQNKTSKMNHLKHELNHVSRKIPVLELTGRQTGYKLLKSALKESNTRMHSVKYGVPFLETLDNDYKYHLYDESDKTNNDLNTIDYKHLVFDVDKQNYFTHLVNLRKKELCNDLSQATSEKIKTNTEKKKKSKKQEKDGQNLKNINLKKFEESLQFKQNLNVNPIGKFYETRDRYYEQRQRLNNMLEEDLNRLEFNRSKIFRRKFCALTISKNNGFADDDLQRMRTIVNNDLKLERERIIKKHPWYNDMVNKIIYTTGSARELSETENILLRQIRNIIEDGIPFSRISYINILKIIPPSEFMSENIQRILRFIKQHEPIAERDYMEAVEASGHSMKVVNTNDDDDDVNNNNNNNDNNNNNNNNVNDNDNANDKANGDNDDDNENDDNDNDNNEEDNENDNDNNPENNNE